MTSTSASHGKYTGKPHTVRHITIAMDGETPYQPANKANGSHRAKEHPEPLVPHVKGHTPWSIAGPTEIARRMCEQPRTSAEMREPPLFPEFIKWWMAKRGEKPAAGLAALMNESPRTCERWVSGEVEVPTRVVLFTIQKLFGGYR